MTKEVVMQGDCLEKLKELEDNSIDSVVTDPPYGLSKEPDITEVLSKWLAGEEYDHGHGGFMGKSWDSFVPHPDIWKEVFRVLKPGGHALVFAGTRTQDLMTISLRLAGFEVRDVIEWLYFSGFPKSHDVGKAFDRRAGKRKVNVEKLKEKLIELRDNRGYTNMEINKLCGFEASNFFRTDNHLINIFPRGEKWEILKEILSGGAKLDAELDLLYEEAEREKIGEIKTRIDSPGTPTMGNDSISGIVDITAPATELARKWDGWGTALKPAHEPIIVVRKPLVDTDTGRKLTVADCVEKYGTGAINVDASRIGDGENRAQGGLRKEHHNENLTTVAHTAVQEERPTGGRFPANCITLDSDEFYSKYFNISPAELSKKASKKDRNSDWKGEEITLDIRPAGGLQGRADGSLGKQTFNRNTHPTVKPVDLMAWLVRLVTPPNGTVLDPFAGSGSTLVAAKREGFGFIGIEREPEYVEIIEARTEVAATK